MKKVLVVDDELGIRALLSEILEEEGYNVLTAENAQKCRETLKEQSVDLMLLDIWMPDTDGVTLLKELCVTRSINCPVIMMSGHGTIETAMEATRFGAIDFLEKPITLSRLIDTCSRALETWETTDFRKSLLPPIGKSKEQIEREQREQEERQRQLEEQSLIETSQKVANEQLGPFELELPFCTFKQMPRHIENEMPYAIDIADYDITTDDPFPIFEIKPLNMVIDINKDFRDFRDDMEAFYLRAVLTKKNGSVVELSRHSKLERTHLYRKLRSLNINTSRCNHVAARFGNNKNKLKLPDEN